MAKKPEAKQEDRAARVKALTDGQDFGEPADDAGATPATPDPTDSGEGDENNQNPSELEDTEGTATGTDVGGDADGQAQATQSQTYLDMVRELGYDGEDEAEAIRALVSSYRNMATERQQWENRVRETEELARLGTEYLQTQRETAPAAAEQTNTPEPGKEPWWNPPKFDPRWIEQYRDIAIGEDGQPKMGWKPNTPREVVQTAESYEQYLQQWATDLVQRPQEVLPKIIEQEFDRLFEERIRVREEEAQASAFAGQVLEQNRHWMYTRDTQGNEVLSQEGVRMWQLIEEAKSKGMTNPQDRWEYAVYKYDYQNRAVQSKAEQTSQQAQQTAAQKRRQQAARNAGSPNRTGSVAQPHEPPHSQNPNLSPGQKLLQQLRQDGADFV